MATVAEVRRLTAWQHLLIEMREVVPASLRGAFDRWARAPSITAAEVDAAIFSHKVERR
jgi:hypothetical protein